MTADVAKEVHAFICTAVSGDATLIGYEACEKQGRMKFLRHDGPDAHVFDEYTFCTTACFIIRRSWSTRNHLESRFRKSCDMPFASCWRPKCLTFRPSHVTLDAACNVSYLSTWFTNVWDSRDIYCNPRRRTTYERTRIESTCQAVHQSSHASHGHVFDHLS